MSVFLRNQIVLLHFIIKVYCYTVFFTQKLVVLLKFYKCASSSVQVCVITFDLNRIDVNIAIIYSKIAIIYNEWE